MKILVLNCGSSSVKFQLIEMEGEEVLTKGIVEKIGSSEAILTYKPKNKNNIVQTREILNHDVAIGLVLNTLMHPKHGVIKDKNEIDGIGHRLVHGGEEFVQSELITEKVKEGVRRCIQFAPLHNPHNLKGIEVCEQLLPGVPQVGVFDTAFHHTLPPHAYMYALPMAMYRKHKIRRYGFHGTSHGYVARKAAEYLGKPFESLRIITCHLGNGSSITAIKNGQSVETSMGFTPLEGLVMGTRCGDIDPALVPHIAKIENLNLAQVDSLLNKNSGMLGLTETTNDFREIEMETEKGSEQHKLALEIFCHRLRKYIGAYIAVLGGLDILVFTAGIGENSANVRQLTLSGLESLGISIDLEKNAGNEFDVGTGKVKVLVVPTNEELAIARDTRAILLSLQQELEKTVPEELISKELSKISGDDRAELMAIWLSNPHITIYELAELLQNRTNKKFSLQVLKKEMELLGLNEVSEEKKLQLAKLQK
ncbi:acetate kinase [candidate division KSB1 bacterium]|nr:acetate kinase [candidate division KSB1 bacterium]